MKAEAIELLRRINPGQSDGCVKPHKYALLMAIIDLYEKQPNRANSFHIDHDLEKLFEKNIRQLVPELRYSPSMIDAPFFYLQTDLVWFMLVKDGKVVEYEDILREKNRRF